MTLSYSTYSLCWTKMLNGTMHSLKEEAGAVSFNMCQEKFNKVYLLVDGIYPRYSRLVRGIKEPITRDEKVFTSWQEGARKDIERAFGVPKITLQWLSRPIWLHKLEDVSARLVSCLILHNILVTGRVVDGSFYNYRDRYNPAAWMEEEKIELLQQEDMRQPQYVEVTGDDGTASVTGITAMHTFIRAFIARQDRFKELQDKEENQRLHKALMKRSKQVCNSNS